MKIPVKLKTLKLIFTLLLLTAFGVSIFQAYQAPNFYWSIARHQTGNLAWLTLVFIIYISLLSKLFKKVQLFKQLLPLRKEAGILIFIIALFHGTSHLIVSEVSSIQEIFKEIFASSSIWIASLSLLIMFPLFLTSNKYSIKKLNGKNWKNLHKLTHLAFILAGLHIMLLPYSYSQSLNPKPLIFLIPYLLGYIYLFIKKQLNSKKND